MEFVTSYTKPELEQLIIDSVLKCLNSTVIPQKEVKYISRQQARIKLGISMPTLDKAIDDGTLKGYRIGGRILLKENELSDFNNRKHK